jgi:hypothetical protein
VNSQVKQPHTYYIHRLRSTGNLRDFICSRHNAWVSTHGEDGRAKIYPLNAAYGGDGHTGFTTDGLACVGHGVAGEGEFVVYDDGIPGLGTPLGSLELSFKAYR